MIELDRVRVMLYSQHVSGVGHYFRCREIIRALSLNHEVYFVDGGREIPSVELVETVKYTQLPAISKDVETGELIGADLHRNLNETLRDRAQILKDKISKSRPDILIIEYFPFAREDFSFELMAAIREMRETNPRAKIICSLRDIAGRTKNSNFSNQAPPKPSESEYDSKILNYLHPEFDISEKKRRLNTLNYYQSVISILNQHFDYLFVHADEKLTVLNDHFHWVNEIHIPIVYTGYISEKLSSVPVREEFGEDGKCFIEDHCVLVSAGGGVDGYDLAMPCVDAWKQLWKSGFIGDRKMVIFMGAFVDESEYENLKKTCADGPFIVNRFTSNFLHWMQAADFSISRAGYNTCMNVLETKTPALFIPYQSSAEQEFRAKRLAELGIAEIIDQKHINPQKLASMIKHGFNKGQVVHDIFLDGAHKTCQILENIMSPIQNNKITAPPSA